MIDKLFANPVLILIGVALLLAIVYSIVKKLLKLALLVGVLFAGVVGYGLVTGQQPKEAMQDLGSKMKDGVKKGAKAGAEKAGALIEKGKEAGAKKADELKDKAAAEVKEEVKKAVSGNPSE